MIKINKFDGDPSYPCADVSLETDKNEGGFEHEMSRTWRSRNDMDTAQHVPPTPLRVKLAFAFCRVVP